MTCSTPQYVAVPNQGTFAFFRILRCEVIESVALRSQISESYSRAILPNESH